MKIDALKQIDDKIIHYNIYYLAKNFTIFQFYIQSVPKIWKGSNILETMYFGIKNFFTEKKL